MTTGGLILLIIFFIGIKSFENDIAKQAKNYDYRKVSMGKMAMDSGKSKKYKYQKMISGGYDKDDQWRI